MKPKAVSGSAWKGGGSRTGKGGTSSVPIKKGKFFERSENSNSDSANVKFDGVYLSYSDFI